MKTIVLGSDHAGIMLKEQIKSYLLEEGYFILDKGCYTSESCDYPDIAELVSREINSETKGILVCGTGIGMSIKANRYNHIRCGLCTNELMAEMTRKHNDANVLAIGARILDNDISFKIITKFLNTEFEGGRHQKRIDKLNIDSIRDIADIL